MTLKSGTGHIKRKLDIFKVEDFSDRFLLKEHSCLDSF